jgi:hypothetical protein
MFPSLGTNSAKATGKLRSPCSETIPGAQVLLPTFRQHPPELHTPAFSSSVKAAHMTIGHQDQPSFREHFDDVRR